MTEDIFAYKRKLFIETGEVSFKNILNLVRERNQGNRTNK